MTPTEAENVLQAWGAFKRSEFEDEVGYPHVSASCAGYDSPEWGNNPPPNVTHRDIIQACWVMHQMSGRHKRLYVDLKEHYQDGRRLSFNRLDEGKIAFSRIWYECPQEVREVA